LDTINIQDFKPKEKTHLNICYPNNTRKRINDELNVFYSKNTEIIKVEAKQGNSRTQNGFIYAGCPIISYRTIRINKKGEIEKKKPKKEKSAEPVKRKRNEKKVEKEEKAWICNSDDFIIKGIDIEKQIFTITYYNDETEKEEDIAIAVQNFNQIFLLGYARTVHSVQGASLSEEYTIWEWSHYNFDDRLKYVSLSRARNFEQVHIMP
jgi:hypothetical protein